MNRRRFLQSLLAVPLAIKHAVPYVHGILRRGFVTIPVNPIPPSVYEEYALGVMKTGPFTMTLNKPTMLPMLGEVQKMRIDLPSGDRFEFDGFVKAYTPHAPIDGNASADFEVQPTGPMVHSSQPIGQPVSWNGQELTDIKLPAMTRDEINITSIGGGCVGPCTCADSDYEDDWSERSDEEV